MPHFSVFLRGVAVVLLGATACGNHRLAARQPVPSVTTTGTGTDDPHGPYAVEAGLDPYAAAIEQATGGRHAEPSGYCDVAIDPYHDGLIVWWRGIPTPAVAAILRRAHRNGVRVTVHRARFDRHQLGPIRDRLEARMPGLRINSLSIAPDCSAVTVGMSHPTPATEAPIRAAAGPHAPLKFVIQAPLRPAGLVLPKPSR